MNLNYTVGFLRCYEKLTLDIRNQIDKQLALLASDPHHPSLRTHKRRGEDDVWQARITRSYRLYFKMEGDIITLVSVGPHDK